MADEVSRDLEPGVARTPEPERGPEPELFDAPEALLEAESAGYSRGLSNRHIHMIAVGGAIGTGLFLGVGGRLNAAGPSLFILFAVCGVAVFLVLRALAEMVIHRPTSGSFVSYAREFIGEKGAFVSGWMYVLLWATIGIADITAVAVYADYWSIFTDIPQGAIAAVALMFVLSINLLSAKLFGELEFWGSILKVGGLVVFMAIGIFFLMSRKDVAGTPTGLGMVADNGGLFPHGVFAAALVIPGVLFAYSALELVSIAAGETKDPRRIVPKTTNAVIYRVALLYCGSVLLLALLMPWSSYSAGESPFVTFLDAIGVTSAASIMNLIVLTAALSSVNSGLYATGRILRTMSVGGHAPEFAQRMSKRKVPIGGIMLVAGAYLFGILLNFVVPESAFEYMVNLAALGILCTWGTILFAHTLYLRKINRGGGARGSFRMPLAPYSNWAVLVFLALVFVLMWWDVPTGRFTVIASIPIGLALAAGWLFVRKRVAAITASYAQKDAERPDI